MLASQDTDLQPPFQPLPLTLEPNPDCDQAHETGGYINYRQDDMVRGHGNQPPWKAAGRLPSTELGLQSLTLTELLADMRHWRERKAGCLAPCALPPPSPPPDASGAPLAAAGLASAAWSEVSSSSHSAAWSEVSSSSQSAARSGVCSTHCQPPLPLSLPMTSTLTLIPSMASPLTLTTLGRSAGSITPSRRVPPSCARAACGRG